MKVYVFLVYFILFCNQFIFAQNVVEKTVNRLMAKTEYKNALLGIHVEDLETGEVLVGRNSEKLLVPASALKLIATAAAFEMLGPSYHFQTRFGYTGKIDNGALKGDLVVIGGGDPALGSEYFMENYFNPHFLEVWAQRIKASGISRVEGNLIVDDSFYGTEKIPPAWIWEDIGNYYGAGSYALTVYDNILRVSFSSPEKAGEPTKIVSVVPNLEDLVWKNEVLSSDENRDLAYVFGSPFGNRRVIRGTIPKNRKLFTIKASNPFPEKLLANDYLFYLAQAGIFVSGKLVNEKVNKQEFLQVDVLESPPLNEIIKALNHESVNLFAEHLVKQIAAEKTGKGDRLSGLKIITQFWKKNGLDTDQLFMEDGSGLSPFNAVSPSFLSSVCRYMALESQNSRYFFESLPAPGQGTLQQFNSLLFPENSLRMKTGSMERVNCFAGYFSSPGGKKYVFSFMINHYDGPRKNVVADLEILLNSIQ